MVEKSLKLARKSQKTFFLSSMGSHNCIKKYIRKNASVARVEILLHDVGSEDSMQTVEWISRNFKSQFPDHSITLSSLGSYLHKQNDELSEELIYGFWKPLFVIGLILFAFFGSVRWTLIAIAPNLIPPCALAIALSFWETSISPDVAMIFSIVLGMAFDNTVYLIEAARRKLRTHGFFDVTDIVKEEGHACCLSNSIVIIGFSGFLLSQFSANQTFGIFMILTLISALIADIFLLPRILFLFQKFLSAKPQWNRIPAKGLAASLLISVFLFGQNSNSADSHSQTQSGQKIIESMTQKMSSSTEDGKMRMVIIASDGAKSLRELEMKRISKGNKQKVIVKIQEPADLRGMGFLSQIESGKTQQWVYSPSSGRTRRISSGQKNTPFLDSELSYRDFNYETYEQFNSELKKTVNIKKQSFWKVVSLAKNEDAPYKKIITWVNTKTNLPLKAKYFIEDTKSADKEMRFLSFKKFGKKTWRASKTVVKNLKNKKKTILTIQKLNTKTTIDEDDVSLAALEEL